MDKSAWEHPVSRSYEPPKSDYSSCAALMVLCGQHCDFHTSGGGSAAALFQSSELGAPLKGEEEEAPYKRTREVQSPPPSSDSDLPIARRRWFSSVRFVPNPRGGRLARAKGRKGKEEKRAWKEEKEERGALLPLSIPSESVLRRALGSGDGRDVLDGAKCTRSSTRFYGFFAGGKKAAEFS